MRNYVKEMETIKRKKESLFLGFLLGILFFVVYSGIILTGHTFLRDICFISSMASILLAATYAKEEKSIITDVESARELIESKGEDFDDRKVNALVSLFRSRKKDMGWKEVFEILRDYDYDEDILWQVEEKKYERKRLWEKQSTI